MCVSTSGGSVAHNAVRQVLWKPARRSAGTSRSWLPRTRSRSPGHSARSGLGATDRAVGEPNREPEDMNATTLKALYEAQLEEDLQPPVDPDVDRRGTRGMLRVSRRLPAGDLVEANCGRIWVWSDLHLGHSTSISSFARPFESTREADDAFFRNWHRTVGPGDTIICLGDVAIGGLSGTRLRRLRSAPGRKIVVHRQPRDQRRGRARDPRAARAPWFEVRPRDQFAGGLRRATGDQVRHRDTACKRDGISQARLGLGHRDRISETTFARLLDNRSMWCAASS